MSEFEPNVRSALSSEMLGYGGSMMSQCIHFNKRKVQNGRNTGAEKVRSQYLRNCDLRITLFDLGIAIMSNS